MGNVSFYLGILITLVESFLLGSIPCGVIVGRALYRGDPRDSGSGSIGMTNMARVFGAKAAAITFVGDVAKGALAVAVVRLMVPVLALDAQWQVDLLLVLGCMGAIFGHVYCPWLGWRGGKGISTGFGSLLTAFPPIALFILAAFAVAVALTRRISVGSICGAVGVPVAACVFYWGSVPILVCGLAIMVAVVYAHRGNIKRLIAGTEPTFRFKHSNGEEKGDQGK